jgi:hypothetical protein
MSEYDNEPVRGLPGLLPAGERILWQGSPDWKAMAVSALHIRVTAVYFSAIIIWAAMKGDANTGTAVAVLGAAVIALQTLFTWGVGRTTVYTLTDKRIVLRIGVALNKCINLPLAEIEAANLKMLGDGHGNIVLNLKGMPRLGYWMLWPHARSLRIVRPQPMLRAIPDARDFAQLLFKTTQKVQSIVPATMRPEVRQNIPLAGIPA